ncbi:hypothetical protein M0D69_13885 [Caballeronia sp. SEWSISQ10-4 2]|uniref:hypothetical protein n=1 Tax=Caballeronia sp. SEWSISQ10-4 2 TaxID=2937438 RepID=UPI0026533804|nr:hypothetical protein [Caballeronia sp. SEWSISQ10-4 2]MDN7179084.1 hypothetical protein [Caballeronia sp. SEWSISQ10-4 2]
MNTADQARILYAFLARVTTRDLDAIVITRRLLADAAMNGNNRSQLDAQAKLVQACERAVTGLIEHDRNLIAGVISANGVDLPADPTPTDEGVFTIYGNRTDCKILHYHGSGTYDVERKSDGKCFRVSGMALPIKSPREPVRDGACIECNEHESHCNCHGQIDKSMGLADKLMDAEWKLPETSQRKPETKLAPDAAWPFPATTSRKTQA